MNKISQNIIKQPTLESPESETPAPTQKDVENIQQNIEKKLIVKDSLLEDPKEFMRKIEESLEDVDLNTVNETLLELERYSQTPNRKIEVYTDPELETFLCAEIDGEKIDNKGEITPDPQKKTHIIGVPFHFAAGGVSQRFLRGEIKHEQGHAIWSDYNLIKNLETLARQDKYDPKYLQELWNCIEDPRMERLQGGPLNNNTRQELFEKNRQWIIPNIAEGISEDPVPFSQLNFLIKLERIWALHKNDFGNTEKPWKQEELHPRVQEIYKKIEPFVIQITGDHIRPSLKINAEVETLIATKIWPECKKLLDEFPPEQDDKPKKPGEKGETGKSGEPGEPGKSGEPGESPEHLDPKNPKNWPEPYKSFFKKFMKQHQQKLQNKSDQTKKEYEASKEDKDKRDQRIHEQQKIRDGFEDPHLREVYNTLLKESRPAINRIKRIFKRYLPNVSDLDYTWGKRGTKYNERRRIRTAGTGNENPLGKKEIPTKPLMVLQINLDVSGSMYGDNSQRIHNALLSCISLSEASLDHNILLEILVNDDKNLNDDIKYIIKDFKEKYSGSVKSRLASLLDPKNFAGGNEDAKAIDIASSRIIKQVKQSRGMADGVAPLMIYISDSTTQSIETKKSSDKARKRVPFEGTAITNEADIPKQVQYHFGPDSVIPKNLNEFATAFEEILKRHMLHLRRRQ
jgi:hypothetical protein